MKINRIFKRLERVEVQLSKHEIEEAVIEYSRLIMAGLPKSRPNVEIYEMMDNSEQTETVADLEWSIDRGQLPDEEDVSVAAKDSPERQETQ